MKEYGFNLCTEYTRKQAGVIYSNAKRGNLNVPEEVMSEIYYYASQMMTRDDIRVNSAYNAEAYTKQILDGIFNNDFETAQKAVDTFNSIL